jgi:hypothetical protein
MPLDWDDGTLSGYSPTLTFPRLRLGIRNKFTNEFCLAAELADFYYI